MAAVDRKWSLYNALGFGNSRWKQFIFPGLAYWTCILELFLLELFQALLVGYSSPIYWLSAQKNSAWQWIVGVWDAAGRKTHLIFFSLFLIASICFSTAKTGREISGNNWLFRGCLGDITSRQFNNWSMCYFFSKRSRSILLHELWNVKSHRVKYSALKQDFTNFRWKKSKLQKSSHYFDNWISVFSPRVHPNQQSCHVCARCCHKIHRTATVFRVYFNEIFNFSLAVDALGKITLKTRRRDRVGFQQND